jgi:adenylate kinase family enzyme
MAQDDKEHAELMAFLTRLQLTGCFTANGVCYDLRRGIKITPEGLSEPLIMPPEFKISMEELPAVEFQGECKQQLLISQVINPGSSKIFIINDSNYSTFFRQVRVDDEGNLSNQPGWVEDCVSKDLMLFSEDLSPGKRERVLTELHKKNKAVSWGDVSQVQEHLHRSGIISEEKTAYKSGAVLMQSTDVDFTVKGLREELAKQKRPCWHVSPVHSNMRFGELMACIEVPAVAEETQRRWGKYEFNRKVQYKQTPLLTALLAGEDVIVHGSLGIDCYGELATLWATPPYVQLNGQRVEVTGRLFLVTPPLAYETAGIKQSPAWKDYEAALMAEFKISPQLTGIIARLGQLYQSAARLEYGKAGMPPHLLWNYHRLRECVKILLKTENSKDQDFDDNPLKSTLLFDYDPFSEEYAFLNVMSKLLFGPNRQPDCRQEKMQKFVKQGDEAVWRQLNCYNGPALGQILKCKKDQIVKNPQLITDLLDIKNKSGLPKLLAPIKKVYSFPLVESKTLDVKPAIANKHLRKVLGFLKQNPFAFLKGLPGTGKSFTSEILARRTVEGFGSVATFWGEEKIESWIQAKDGDYFILFIDEANLNNPQDYWNFLKDLRQQPPSIYWKGQRILLSPKHKVIFTGNPEHYSQQRDFHQFLEEMPIDFYKAWSDEKIIAHLSKLWQEITSKISSTEEKLEIPVIKCIVTAMHTLEETFPTLFPPGRLTLRDLHQAMHRLGIRCDSGLDFKNLAYTVCVDEWLPLLPTHKQRDDFRQKLNKLFAIEKYPADLDEKLITDNPDWNKIRESLHIPQERWHDVLVMYEDLKLQTQFSSTDHSYRIKNAILLEGPSGIGKTTLLLSLFKTLGYRKLTPDELTTAFKHAQLNDKDLKLSPKTFIHLTAGDAHNAELLTQAFMLGIPVVFDELDLQPLPELLNHLLTGATPDKVKPYRQGFFLAASLNSGRAKLPLDFENRFRKIYLQAYSDAELLEIATQALTKAGMEFKPEDAIEFVNKYCQARTLRNGKMNSRNFFRTLKKVIDKSPRERSFMKCWNTLLDERREKMLVKEQRELIADAEETGIPEDKQEVSATFSPQESQPVSEKVNFEMSLPVNAFLAELIRLNPDSAQEFKTTRTRLAEIYRTRPLVTPPVSQSFFSFMDSTPSANCQINSIYLICLLQMTPVEHEQRLAILQKAARIAATLPKAKTLSPKILADENQLLAYLADSRQNNWAMKEALLWIMQQGWDKEFVAAAPSQTSLFTAMTAVKSVQGHSTADQKFFKPLEHKATPGKFILYVNSLNQLVLRFEDEKNCGRFLGKIGQGQIPTDFRKGPQFVKNTNSLIPVQESKHSLTFCTYNANGGELAINLVDHTRQNNFIRHLQLKITSRHHLPVSNENQYNYLNGQLHTFTNNPTALYFPALANRPGAFIKVEGEKVSTGIEDVNKLATEPFDAICERSESSIKSDSFPSLLKGEV